MQNNKPHGSASWLRITLQGTTLICVAMIGLIWTGVILYLDAECENVERTAIQTSGKLARTFEENIIRSIKEVDAALLFLRATYEKDPEKFAISDWIGGGNYRSDLTLQISITGADGFIKQISIVGPDGFIEPSNVGPSVVSVNLSDREHFNIHVDAQDDKLFISKPVIGRTTGKMSIQLTRRIRGANNTFDGIVAAALDPSYFARFYESIDIGQDGAVAVIGLDGIIRAQAGYKEDRIGQSVLGTTEFQRFQQESAGYFYSGAAFGGLKQIVSYQRVRGYPLIVTVGLGRDEVFAHYWREQRSYYGVAAGLTLFTLIIMGLGIRHAQRLDHAHEISDTQNRHLDAALNNMSQGLCMFDAAQRLVVYNARYFELYKLTPGVIKQGSTLREIIDHLVQVGIVDGDQNKRLAAFLADMADGKTTQVTRELADGRTIVVINRPLLGGGWVATHEDVTAQRRAENELANTRNFLDTVIEHVPATILVKDARDFRYVLLNQAGLDFFGLPRDRIIGKTAHAFFPKDVADSILARDAELLSAGTQNFYDDHSIHTTGQGLRRVTTKRLVIRGTDGAPRYLLGVIEDITERTRAEDKIREQKLLTETAISNMSQGLVMFDAQHRMVLCNSRYIEIYNMDPELVRPGCTLRELNNHRKEIGLVAGDPEKRTRDILTGVAKGQAWTELVTLPDQRCVQKITRPMPGGGWVATHEDITERRLADERIKYMAHHDLLTGLPNRTLLHERLNEATLRVPRGESLAVLYLDLDRFKSINDTLGHLIGDELLKVVADRLRGCVREIDTVARLGGDEFAIIQTAIEDPLDAATLARRIREAITAPCDFDGFQVLTDVSIGISIAPNDASESEQLLKNADMALYGAKADGRGAFRFFEPQMDAHVKARRALELDLRKALADGEFELYYQPLVNLERDEVKGCEALLRWHHPERGMISPAEFIPVAEETGLITSIGEWVLRTACAEAATWPDDITVAVNVSPVQFKNQTLALTVIGALAASGLPARRLEIEITEAVLMQNNEATVATLHQLHDLGVRIAMDDFGTGYSSLSYLRSFPFDKIKIDRSFINDLSDKDDSGAIVRAVTGMASSLSMTTTAEGVETQAQLGRIRALGCTEVQGYLFSRPVPANEILQFFPACAYGAKQAVSAG